MPVIQYLQKKLFNFNKNGHIHEKSAVVKKCFAIENAGKQWLETSVLNENVKSMIKKFKKEVIRAHCTTLVAHCTLANQQHLRVVLLHDLFLLLDMSNSLPVSDLFQILISDLFRLRVLKLIKSDTSVHKITFCQVTSQEQAKPLRTLLLDISKTKVTLARQLSQKLVIGQSSQRIQKILPICIGNSLNWEKNNKK